MAKQARIGPPMKDERHDARHDTLRFPGCFTNPETGMNVFCQIVNISGEGIGIHSQTYLTPKTTLMWVTLEKVIPFEVVWCLEKSPTSPDDPYKYQCGLIALDGDKTQLTDLFGFIQHQS